LQFKDKNSLCVSTKHFPGFFQRGDRFKPWGEVKLVSFTGRQVEVVPQDNKQKKMSGESDLA
jgi:hypothetical protein